MLGIVGCIGCGKKRCGEKSAQISCLAFGMSILLLLWWFDSPAYRISSFWFGCWLLTSPGNGCIELSCLGKYYWTKEECFFKPSDWSIEDIGPIRRSEKMLKVRGTIKVLGFCFDVHSVVWPGRGVCRTLRTYLVKGTDVYATTQGYVFWVQTKNPGFLEPFLGEGVVCSEGRGQDRRHHKRQDVQAVQDALRYCALEEDD